MLLGTDRVEYLGYIISQGTISMYQSTVDCVMNWSLPISLKELRGFLDLTGYTTEDSSSIMVSYLGL